jgi:predicted PurR-regulated permease PerM
MSTHTTPDVTRSDLFVWACAAIALLLILQLKLLTALLAGLLVHELVFVLAALFGLRALGNERAKVVAVLMISVFVISLFALSIVAIISFLRHGSESLPALLNKLAEIVDASRTQLPQWLIDYIPTDTEELRSTVTNLLRTHADLLPGAGRNLLVVLAHSLIGMVIGGLLAIRTASSAQTLRPVARAIFISAARLASAFRRVVFAQVWIAAINTTITALYLVVVLPLLGIHLPLVKTLIALTFIAGLIPILGNLISNTAIVLVSLSASLSMALGSLVFLVSVHKLEYFLNARIVGSHIRAQAWELLLAMLVMEAAFGLPGLVAAPIYYAYFKDELSDKQLL